MFLLEIQTHTLKDILFNQTIEPWIHGIIHSMILTLVQSHSCVGCLSHSIVINNMIVPLPCEACSQRSHDHSIEEPASTCHEACQKFSWEVSWCHSLTQSPSWMTSRLRRMMSYSNANSSSISCLPPLLPLPPALESSLKTRLGGRLASQSVGPWELIPMTQRIRSIDKCACTQDEVNKRWP